MARRYADTDDTDVYDDEACTECGYINCPHATDDDSRCLEDPEACDCGDVGTVDDDALPTYDGPTCYYCGDPIIEPRTRTIGIVLEPSNYCSALCACYAERDNLEDRL